MSNPYYIPPRGDLPGDNFVRNMMALADIKMRRDHGREQLQLDRDKLAFKQAADPLSRKFNAPDNLAMKKLFDSIGMGKSSFLEEADNWINNPNMTHGNIFAHLQGRRGDFIKELTKSAMENAKKPGHAGSELEQIQNSLLEAASTDEGWEEVLGRAFPQVAEYRKAERDKATLAAYDRQLKEQQWEREQLRKERSTENDVARGQAYITGTLAAANYNNRRAAHVGSGKGKGKEPKPSYTRKEVDAAERNILYYHMPEPELDKNGKRTGNTTGNTIYKSEDIMKTDLDVFNSASTKPYYYHYGKDKNGKPTLHRYTLPKLDGRYITPASIQATANLYNWTWDEARINMVDKARQQGKAEK